MPIAPGGAKAINDPWPLHCSGLLWPLQSTSHCVLGCSGHSSPLGPLCVSFCFSASPPTVSQQETESGDHNSSPQQETESGVITVLLNKKLRVES